jgi:hypothetical protein
MKMKNIGFFLIIFFMVNINSINGEDGINNKQARDENRTQRNINVEQAISCINKQVPEYFRPMGDNFYMYPNYDGNDVWLVTLGNDIVYRGVYVLS